VADAEDEGSAASRVGTNPPLRAALAGPLLKKREKWRTPSYYGSRLGEGAHPPVKGFANKEGSNNSYLLIFYDTTKFRAEQVKGTRFLCRHAQVDVPIWTFEFRDGTWKAAHPIFNAETDQWCSAEY
jgi:hypothetical protein